MKKLGIRIMMLMTVGCGKEEVSQDTLASEVKSLNQIITKPTTDTKLLQLVSEWDNKYALELNDSLLSKVSLNFKLPYTSYEGNPNNGFALSVAQIDTTSKLSSIGVSMFVYNDTIRTACIIKTSEEINGNRTIDYLDYVTGELYLSILLNPKTQKMSYIHVPGYKRMSGWGQRTIDCVSDVYSNHRWASVWAAVQSAFIPQTAAAIAGACAVKNYN
jgi:hypothetical protein